MQANKMKTDKSQHFIFKVMTFVMLHSYMVVKSHVKILFCTIYYYSKNFRILKLRINDSKLYNQPTYITLDKNKSISKFYQLYNFLYF